MIKLIKQVICDYCCCAIDYIDKKSSNKEVKMIVKKAGAIVEGNKIFCSNECKKKYKNLMKKMDDYAKQIKEEYGRTKKDSRV